MRSIPYWIQRANFSTTDYGPVEVAEGIRAFEDHDWSSELRLFSELENAGADCCPPGIGFVAGDGIHLHICPGPYDESLVHYHHTATHKILGFIPVTRTRMEMAENVPRDAVLNLIHLFFEGRRDRMSEKFAAIA